MRFIQQLPSNFTNKNSPNSAKAQFMKAIKKGSKKPEPPSAEERYNEIYKAKVEEIRNKAMQGAKYTFQLPGTDSSECKKLSKGAQEIIEKIAEKKAKQAEKRAKKADVIKITPKHFTGMQGGRIDGKGHVFDSAGQWVMTVDKKSGKIKNRVTGSTMGKYNPGCTYSEHRMCELIGQLDTTKQNGWYAGSSGHGSAMPGEGTVWGSETNSCGGGSLWGDNTGGFWGGGSDDKKDGGWW